MNKKIPEKIPLEPHPGETQNVRFNAPMRLRVTTLEGGVIEAVISPSHPLTMTEPSTGWDLKNIELDIEAELLPQGPKLVE